MSHFTPYTALLGGALIGLATAMLLLLDGRTAGISGILRGLVLPAGGATGWRIAFVAGLLAGPAVYVALTGQTPPLSHLAATPVLVVAGLAVGIGTAISGGCTSGHGICGMARLSPRSLAATGTFMLLGFATVYLTRHLVGA